MKIQGSESLINSISLKQSSANASATRKTTKGMPQEGTMPTSVRKNVEAMVLAQISKSVIDKAIAISSRLRSMAGQALATGVIDNEEVQTELSRMQGTISQYGEKIFTPAPDVGEVKEQFIENAQRVQEIGENILVGKYREEDLAKLDRAVDNFRELGETKLGRNPEIPMERPEAEKLTRGITTGIVSDSRSFLEAQGNLSSFSAKLATN